MRVDSINAGETPTDILVRFLNEGAATISGSWSTVAIEI